MQKSPCLTNDERLLLGVVVHMAQVEKMGQASRGNLADFIAKQWMLPAHGREEVRALFHTPPSLQELAHWAATDVERICAYSYAVRMMEKTQSPEPRPTDLLDRLAAVFSLSAEEIDLAREMETTSLASSNWTPRI